MVRLLDYDDRYEDDTQHEDNFGMQMARQNHCKLGGSNSSRKSLMEKLEYFYFAIKITKLQRRYFDWLVGSREELLESKFQAEPTELATKLNLLARYAYHAMLTKMTLNFVGGCRF